MLSNITFLYLELMFCKSNGINKTSWKTLKKNLSTEILARVGDITYPQIYVFTAEELV